MATRVKYCSNPKCVSEFQDKVYGPHMRLFNEAGKDKVDELRCTVCGTEVRLDAKK